MESGKLVLNAFRGALGEADSQRHAADMPAAATDKASRRPTARTNLDSPQGLYLADACQSSLVIIPREVDVVQPARKRRCDCETGDHRDGDQGR
jgi:hypothetical protein